MRDAAYSPPLAPAGTGGEEELDQQEVQNSDGDGLRPAMPESSMLFRDLGGRDVYEAADAMPIILQDLRRTYTAVVRTPGRCVAASLFRLQLRPISEGGPTTDWWIAPQWLLQRDLGKSTPND